ncbi:MAG: hypothetical protein M3Y27_02210 [Acidobacteriota bacterium]|nr:hypothetical protein [Acidobacteriota bacterium]
MIRAATEALPAVFPNPDRLSCPEAITLEAIAGRCLSFPNIDGLLDHIATCSPCFTAYTLYRGEYCSRRNRRRYVAVVAVLTVVIAAGYFGHRVLSPIHRPPEQISEVAPLTAVLDFHNRTSERSVQAPPQEPLETPHLRRAVLNVQLLLPLGSEDGQYSVQFRNNAGGIAAQSTGTAKWDRTTETLSARIDLRRIERGQYTLALRNGNSSWREYSVFVD